MTNIMEIEIIENLLIEVNNHVNLIDPGGNPSLAAAKSQIYENLNEIQTEDLHDLRELCEGDI